MVIINTKKRHQFMKNVINILSKGLKSVELLSKRYNQYYFDKINNESSQNDEYYEESEKNLLSELIDFNLEAMDKFMEVWKIEVEKIPKSFYSTQYNIGNALTRPKSEAEIEYYLICYYLFELCQYGLAYTFIVAQNEFKHINTQKYRDIIDNYKLKDYLLSKWFPKLITIASDLHIDISKLFYINNCEKYNQYLNEMETEIDENITNEYPFSLEGRSALLSAIYVLPHQPCFTAVDNLPEHQLSTFLHHFFPKILHPTYVFYGSFDYLNVLMNLNQDIGIISHILTTLNYMKSITQKNFVNLKDLKNVNDVNSVNFLTLIKNYVSLMVTVPYAIIRDRMYLLLKEMIKCLTEEARFSVIMEIIQNSFTESIVVLGIVLYKEALHEAWMEEVYGTQDSKKPHKKSLYFSRDFLDIVRKTLFNLKSPVYEPFHSDLKFLSEEENEKESSLSSPSQKSSEKSCLDTYEGFWRKFEILFQSLNLYSYLFLRDNKEKVTQIWNSSFNDEVERDFLHPLKDKVHHWQAYLQTQASSTSTTTTDSDDDSHHHHHHHDDHHHPPSHAVNPYSFIPECPEFQLMMMDNMIEQLFALRNDFNASGQE